MGKRLQSVASIFENADVQVYVSRELITELVIVLARPKVRTLVSNDSIEAMWALMREKCYVIEDYPVTSTPVRDPNDVYLLSMADAILADFIVTGDKDLLVLGKHNRTLIVSYIDFTQILLALRTKD